MKINISCELGKSTENYPMYFIPETCLEIRDLNNGAGERFKHIIIHRLFTDIFIF